MEKFFKRTKDEDSYEYFAPVYVSAKGPGGIIINWPSIMVDYSSSNGKFLMLSTNHFVYLYQGQSMWDIGFEEISRDEFSEKLETCYDVEKNRINDILNELNDSDEGSIMRLCIKK